METIRIKVRRQSSPEATPTFEEFSIPFEEDMTVLDALNFLKDHEDGSLTFRWSCRMGICGSCGMMVNGKPVLTCQTFVKDLHAITVEPLRHFPVVKDLVCDIDDPMEKFRTVMPWMTFASKKEAPNTQSPKERKKIDQTSQCIKCMLCYSACPVYGLDEGFLGPAAAALAYRYQADSRDKPASKKERADRVIGKDGVWKCSFVGECSVVCPKRVDPALALQRLKIMGLKHILKVS